MLRDRRFNDFKFVRQYPIGRYITDFCCRKKKLIIELDGGQHNEDKNFKYDQIRDRYLESRGYKVMRIPNNELDENLDGVGDDIYYELNR
jgi:adenine-specific DNA-methyltransferase